MKKLFCTALLAVISLSVVTLKAQTIVLSESFEEGMPATWTQENVIEHQMWSVESDGLYPSGAYEGQKRAFLRNPTDQTIGFKTRLITPEMDLTGVYQPILIFAHAQASWAGDCDTLRVWYRTEAKSAWKILTEYTSTISGWQLETLDLVSVSGSYQLAFEGTDNLGHGIVLDNIQVRSKPECTVPNNLYITNMSEGAVTLGWHASLDANYFQIVLTTEEIGIDTLSRVPEYKVVLNYDMEADSVTYRIRNLEAGQRYWVYVRSLCDNENSEWGSFAFRMNATKQIPYVETFNKDGHGIATQLAAWTFGNNMDTKVPFVSTNLVKNSPDLDLYSPDGTYSLAFVGKYSDVTAAIPAGYYAYAATPELMGAAIKDCQVRFWTTVATYTGRLNACSLIVGVMTDPDDINTFVAIDTVSVYGNLSFKENIVSLASYNGSGRYVAFMSKFNLANRIYLDNLTIEQRPALGKVVDVYVAPRDTEATFTWAPAAGATGYDVLVTTEEVDPTTTTTGDNVLRKETIVGTSYTITGLTAGTNWDTPYYIYVRAVNASHQSEWSYRTPFVTTQTGTIPMAFDLNDKDDNTYTLNGIGNIKYPVEVSLFGNHGSTGYLYPYLDTKNPHRGAGTSLSADLINGEDAWVVFPRLAASQIKNSQIKFYVSGGLNPENVHVALGVMTNPMDINTFVEIEDYYCAAQSYVRCGTSFAAYTGDGEYIAIRWLDSKTAHSIATIDDVTIDAIDDCQAPTGLGANVAETTATVDWAAGGAQNWQVIVTNAYLDDDALENLGDPSDPQNVHPAIIKVAKIAGTPKCDVDNLTPAVNYYFYVRTECNSGYSDWSSAYTFMTSCPAIQPTPYTENFSIYGTGTSAFPTCWTSNFEFGYDASRNHFPYIINQNDRGSDGSGGSLYFYESIESSTGMANYSSVAVAPKLDLPIKETRVQFYLKASGNVPFAVGVMTNPNDYSTFEVVETIRPESSNNWNRVVVDLKNYSGTGEYIAFSTRNTGAKASSQCFVDDVTFCSSRCAQPFNIHPTHIGDTQLTIEWGGVTDDQWEVVLSSQEGQFDGDQLTGVVTLKDTMVTANAITFDGLTTSTAYYIYVRPTCGLKEWNGGMAHTECMCINPRITYRENFDSYESGLGSYPECWTCRNVDMTNNNFIPHVIGSTTYSASLPNLLYFQASGAKSPAWAATPKIDVESLDGVIVSFTGTYSSEATYCFGVMSDPEDISTFVIIDSIPITSSPVVHYYNLSDYKDLLGDAQYVAWCTPFNTTASCSFYLDEITITRTTCPAPNPVVSRITHNSARLASGLRVSNPWRLILTDKELNLEDLEAGNYSMPSGTKLIKDTTFSANIRGYIFNNLEEQTDYYCAVAAICENSTSAWYGTHFSTPCRSQSAEVIGTISFEDAEGYSKKNLPCWFVGNKSNTMESNIPYVDNSGKYAYTGNNALRMHSTTPADNSGFTNGAYAIMPALDVEDIKEMQVNFYARAEPQTVAHKITVGIITDPADLATFVPVKTVDLTDNYSGYNVPFRGYLGDLFGEQGKFIAFMSEFDKKNGVYIDDISVEVAPTCPMPHSVTLELTEENKAKASWIGFSNKYRVVMSYDEVPAKNMESYTKFAFDTIVENKSEVEFSGLKMGTQYFVYVQGICSETDKSVFSTSRVWVKTSCPERVEIPYLCDFDHNTSSGLGVMPDCWTGAFLGTAQKNYPAVVVDAHRGDKGCGLELYAIGIGRTIAILPDLHTDDLSQYMLSFHARKAAAGQSFMVGYVTDINDMDRTFHPIDTIVTTANFHKYYVDLSAYQKELIGARLAFMVNLSIDVVDENDIYVDNVSVAPAPTCKAAEIVNAVPSENSAEISIYAADATQSQWQVAMIEASQFTGEDDLEMNATIKTISETSTTVTGLKAATKYYVYVRAICSATDKSDWSDEAYIFYTDVTYDDSFFFGFEKNEGWLRAANAETDDYYLHPALKTGALTTKDYLYSGYSCENDQYGTYARTDKGALNLTPTQDDGAYVIFPSIETAKDRSFSFDVRPGYASANNKSITKVYYQTKYVLGSVAKGQGMETFEEIVSVTLPTYTTTTLVNEGNNYLFQTYTFNFDENFMRNRQIVLMNKVGETTITIDNVRLGATKAFASPVPKSIFAADTYVDIEFVSADNKTVYLMPGDDVEEFDLNDANLLTFNNITDNAHLTGVEASTNYILRVVATTAPQGAPEMTTFARIIHTQCTPKAWTGGKLVYTFDDGDLEDINQPYPYTWEDYELCYELPSCWQKGCSDMSLTFYGWTVIEPRYMAGNFPPSKGSKVSSIYGINGTNALHCPKGTSTPGAWVSLPYINCDFDTTQLAFYVRTPYEDISTHQVPKLSSGVAYSGHIVVGTCEEQNDISTFTPIDTVFYNRGATSSTVFNNDPEGLDYWQKFTLPLKDAKGRFVTFRAVENQMYFMDNITFEKATTIIAPKGVNVEFGITMANVTWTKEWHPTYKTIVSVYAKDKTTIIQSDTIDAGIMHHEFQNLEPGTRYAINVAQYDGERSSAPEFIEIFTDCMPLTMSYTCSFENAEGVRPVEGGSTSAIIQANCWTFGNAGTSATRNTSFPYVIVNESSKKYSHTGNNAVKLMSVSTTFEGYIVSSAYDGDLDTVQLEFWAIPAYRNGSNVISYTTAVGSTYSKAVEVGTCTDPNDINTFSPIQICEYSKTDLSKKPVCNASNDYWFERFVVPLKDAVGPYVYIRATQYKADGTKKNKCEMYIDDISFSHFTACPIPQNVQQVAATTTSVTVNWTADADNFVVQTVKKDGAQETVVSTNNVSNANDLHSYEVKGLQPSSIYYVRIQSACSSSNKSSWSNDLEVRTNLAPYWKETLSSATMRDIWSTASTAASNLFGDKTGVKRLNGENNTTYGWRLIGNTCGLMGAHYGIPFYSAETHDMYNYYWLVTPSITLDIANSAHLTFNMALTANKSGEPQSDDKAFAGQFTSDQTFMVIVSEDDGLTWKRENATIWMENPAADYLLSAIPYEGQVYAVDLSQYSGKTIKIAFYKESTIYSKDVPFIHINDVRVNNFQHYLSEQDKCQYENAEAYDLVINGDIAKEGINVVNRYTIAEEVENEPTGNDTVYTLRADYRMATQYDMSASFCQGSNFSDYGFFDITREGIYRRKMVSSVTGCDSIITLHLSGIPVPVITEEEHICQGETFTWRGKTFTRSGVYGDTLKSMVTGCDSIHQLILSYFDDEVIRKEVTIGDKDLPYTYESIIYPVGTAPGVYVDTITVQGTSCKATLIHTLIIKRTTDLEELTREQLDRMMYDGQSHKFIYQDRLYILRDAQWYDAQGRKIVAPKQW